MPAASGQDLAYALGQATRLEDLAPADTHGDVTDDSGVDVAVQVVPAVHGPLVAEPAVELDACPPSEVLDVAHRSTVRSLTAGLGQLVRPLDLAEVAALQGGVCTDGDIGQHALDEVTLRSSVRARDATRNKAASMRTRGGERYDCVTSSNFRSRTTRMPLGALGWRVAGTATSMPP
jgi:hypothetical protein